MGYQSKGKYKKEIKNIFKKTFEKILFWKKYFKKYITSKNILKHIS
jgi:hypothetical protein